MSTDANERPLDDLLPIYSIDQCGLNTQNRHRVQHPLPSVQPPLQIDQKDLRGTGTERKQNEGQKITSKVSFLHACSVKQDIPQILLSHLIKAHLVLSFGWSEEEL